MTGADWGYALPLILGLLAVILGGWAATLWTTDRTLPRPPTATRRGPYCEASRCHMPAYWLDTHRDGHHVWTCPGHHDEGHHHGWFTGEAHR